MRMSLTRPNARAAYWYWAVARSGANWRKHFAGSDRTSSSSKTTRCFCPRTRDVAQILSDVLARDGIEIHLNTTVVAVRMEGVRKIVDLMCDDNKLSVSVDEILAGIGRTPNVESMNLEAAGVRYDTESGIRVDDFLQTTNPRIYAAGDVCLEHKFTHAAEASARIVVQNALFLGRKRLSALTIPWCTYTDPEIAHVGLSVREARQKAIPVRPFTILMHDVDRAVTDGEEEGFLGDV